MRAPFLFLTAAGLLPANAAHAQDAAEISDSWWSKPAHLSASLGASTSGTLNGEFSKRPQLTVNLSGSKDRLSFGALHQTANSSNGTDSENRFHLTWHQPGKLASLRYQVMYKTYPGTRAGLTDEALVYQVSASRTLAGVNYALGAEYTDDDYATTRKSYGVNVSVSRGFLPGLSGWLAVSHKKQWGGVDFTNTNIGLYYQATSRIGVSTSINNWRAHADWHVDRPTVSIALNRKL